jgi:ankyrin repeat protein
LGASLPNKTRHLTRPVHSLKVHSVTERAGQVSLCVRPKVSKMDFFFQEAIEQKEANLLIDAIKSGAIRIEDRDACDRTPLMVAVELKEHELAKLLIRMGADVNARSNDGDHCLSRAVENNDVGMLEILMNASANIESQSRGCYSPLGLAAARGFVAIIEFLLKRGANLEAKGEMNETPLMEACFFGQLDAVMCLLTHGADRSAKNAFGESVLEVAIKQGNAAVVEAVKRSSNTA